MGGYYSTGKSLAGGRLAGGGGGGIALFDSPTALGSLGDVGRLHGVPGGHSIIDQVFFW